MIAQSQSGTGKTAAFVLAMLSRVDPKKEYPQVSRHDQNVEQSMYSGHNLCLKIQQVCSN